MIRVTSKGNFAKTKRHLTKLKNGEIFSELNRFGEMGVAALAAATPVNSGESANSWRYRITKTKRGPSIEWYNTNVTEQGTPIVILIQYGHGTGNGGYVQGRDFINPVIQPIFDKIAADVWKKVKR